MNCTVRTLHQLDIARAVPVLLRDLAERGVSREAPHAERALRDFLARNVGHWLIAEVDGNIVGHLALTWAYSLSRGAPKGVVQDVYVHPEWRARGVVRRLLEDAEDRARTYGACRLELVTDHDNDRARHVYRAAGFTELPHKLTLLKSLG